MHLALYLQKHGVDATIITDRTADDYRDIRLLNTVAHHEVTIARENDLGVNHWDDPKHLYYYHDHVFNFPQPCASAATSKIRAALWITASICRY